MQRLEHQYTHATSTHFQSCIFSRYTTEQHNVLTLGHLCLTRGGFRHIQHVRPNRGPHKNGAPTWGPKRNFNNEPSCQKCQHTEIARKSL